MSDVEVLLCRHKDFEKLLASQEEKFARLQQEAAVSRGWGEGAPGDRGVLSQPEGWAPPRY